MKKSRKRSSSPASETPTRGRVRHTLSAAISAWLAAPRRTRALVWLSLALASLLSFLSTECSSIVQSLSSWNALRFEGSYPITMLAFAAVLLTLKRDALARMAAKRAGLDLLRSLLLGVLLIIASLQLHLVSTIGLLPSVMVIIFFILGSLTLAIPEASKLIFALLCLYVAAVSIPTFVEAFLDEQASALYIFLSMPFLARLGFSPQTAGQLIGFTSSSGSAVSMYVDSRCAGSGSFSVFLFLSGLIYLVTRADKKRTVLLISAGCMALCSLNVLRLVVLSYLGYAISSEMMWQAHSYIGHVLFLPFYLAYTWIFFRLARRSGSKTPDIAGMNAADALST